MNKYIIVFPSNTIKPVLLQRIRTYTHYELCPNVFLVQTALETATLLYQQLIDGISDNERMVVFNITNSGYWGFASKDFWPWLRGE